MTELVLLPDESAGDVLLEALGTDPSQVAGIADLLRDEVTAHGACQRAATIKRVCRFVAPAFALEEASVADVCDLLEREGDVVVGAGGVLFATPLRAVDLDGGTLRLASSLSTRRLATLVAGAWNVVGTSRTCLVENVDQARAAVVAAGGVVLTPSAWACLDRVPRADQSWLDGLDRRLKAEPEALSSLERDETLAWCACVAAASGIRWKADNAGRTARLWRARNRWGYWHYAWTQHGNPTQAPFVSLRPDEGTRTTFALARVLGVPLEALITKHDQEAVLDLPHWLPVAEYRFLAVSTFLSGAERNSGRWSMPRDRAASVLEVLRERLGLIVREETI